MKLKDLEHILQSDYKLKDAVELHLCDNYNCFVNLLYKILARIITDIETSRHLQSKYEDEDLITTQIINALKSAGISAAHDQMNSGNVDIVVSIRDYYWLAEAKIYRKITDPVEGFLQLSERYSTARQNQSHGGLLLYIYRKNTFKLMNDWKNKLTSLPDYKNISINDDDKLNFYSIHNHKTSGLKFTVKHIPVILYHQPTDISARNRKK